MSNHNRVKPSKQNPDQLEFAPVSADDSFKEHGDIAAAYLAQHPEYNDDVPSSSAHASKLRPPSENKVEAVNDTRTEDTTRDR